MNDALLDEIRAKLPLYEVVKAHGVELVRSGRGWKGCCPFHNEKTPSFTINDARQTYRCFGCDKRGDVLNFVSFTKLHRDRVGGAEFFEVLKHCAELAGVKIPERDPKDQARIDAMREKQREIDETLTAFAELAASLWTPETRVRARQIGMNHATGNPGKEWITDEAIETWGLGVAPTLQQCMKSGQFGDPVETERRLLRVGLLRESAFTRDEDERTGTKSADGWTKTYMHFRESLIIPHWEGSRVVYLADRAFKTADSAVGWGGRQKKTLNMPVPNEKTGEGGVPMPCGFGFESLYDPRARTEGVLLVEGRLDAIACCERGHPAAAYLSSPSEAFIKKLKPYIETITFYFAPDATQDMTPVKRARLGAKLGYRTRMCVLPPGKDPDDLSSEDLAAVKRDARPVLAEWLELVEMTT